MRLSGSPAAQPPPWRLGPAVPSPRRSAWPTSRRAGGPRRRLQRRAERFNGHAGLLDQSAEPAGLDRLVPRPNQGPAFLAKHGVRPGRPTINQAQPAAGLHGFRTVDVARKLPATAKTGSWTKGRRTRAGALPSSKYAPTASETMLCSSASVSPCVVMPPPAGSSQRATKPPVSAHDSTEKGISTPARSHSAGVRQRSGRPRPRCHGRADRVGLFAPPPGPPSDPSRENPVRESVVLGSFIFRRRGKRFFWEGTPGLGRRR